MADSSGDRSRAGEGTQQGAAGAYVQPDGARAAVSRSRFLSGVTLGLGGLIGAAVSVPVIGFVLGPSFRGESWYWTDLGPADNPQFEPGRYTPNIFNRAPELGTLERRVVFVRRDEGQDAQGNPQFTLVSNVCMHLGCPVVGTNIGFGCPCHGGQYDLEGRRTAGPPVRPLNRFEYKIENGHLFVGRVFATKTRGDGTVYLSDTWKDPGQPVQGILSYLYPAPPR